MPASAASIAARLDRLPPSRTVWIIVILISLGGVFEFYDLFFTAYVAPGMVKTGLFTPQSLGFFADLKGIRVAGFGTFVFSTFIGLWLGVVAFGQAADRFGRKAVFTWSLVWYAGCTGVMAFRQSGEWLNIWRLLAGIGFGVQLVTVDTYISELIPSQLRGRAFSINQLISFCIVPVLALLAWRLVPLTPLGLDGWRWIVLFGTAGAVAVWVLRPFIPESPRWLERQARFAAADAIVTEIERKVRLEYGGELPPVAPSPVRPPGQEAGEVRIREIFAPRYRVRTFMLAVSRAASPSRIAWNTPSSSPSPSPSARCWGCSLRIGWSARFRSSAG
jgi:putative MFS transporter